MNNKGTVKKVKQNTRKTSLELSHPRLVDRFSMQIGTEPYKQLGTGERCEVKRCDQPVYDNNSGLCSYHRMKQEGEAFENRLEARQERAVTERNHARGKGKGLGLN
jgi:hypothetical protein